MIKLPEIYINLFFAIVLSACSTDIKSPRTNISADTIYRKSVVSVNNHDTIWAHDTIYFTPTAVNMPTSNFYYLAYGHSSGAYKVYFPREKVISYCDSMLSELVPYQRDDSGISERVTYEHLKSQALNNKTDSVITDDELPVLLEKFAPLVVNSTGDKPAFVIVDLSHDGFCGVKTFSVTTRSGDTVQLALRVIEDLKLEDVKIEAQDKRPVNIIR